MQTAPTPAASRSSATCESRSPRSAPRCGSRLKPSGSRPSKASWSPAGVNATTAMSGRAAISSAMLADMSWMKLRLSRVASSALNSGASRVLTVPTRGALAISTKAQDPIPTSSRVAEPISRYMHTG